MSMCLLEALSIPWCQSVAMSVYGSVLIFEAKYLGNYGR